MKWLTFLQSIKMMIIFITERNCLKTQSLHAYLRFIRIGPKCKKWEYFDNLKFRNK